jgi:hypothetical protein
VRRSGKSSRKGLIETAELFHTDAKLGQCIVRSEFSEYSITAREKRLQVAASRKKRLPPRANHDDASEDEHGGDADGACEVHGRANCQCIQSKSLARP